MKSERGASLFYIGRKQLDNVALFAYSIWDSAGTRVLVLYTAYIFTVKKTFILEITLDLS